MTKTDELLREFAERLFPYGGAFSAGVIDVQRNRCMNLLRTLIKQVEEEREGFCSPAHSSPKSIRSSKISINT